jgi:hypothetical protein
MARKKAVWISYDFGLKGDYTGLYTWLDEHNAIECGHGIAFLLWDTKDVEHLTAEIEKNLKASVKLSKSDRIYVIWKEPTHGKVKGHFINGSRRQSPWVGYSSMANVTQNDSGE